MLKNEWVIGAGVLAAGILCPALAGAALIGGAIMGLVDSSYTTQGLLEKGFESCRLGVLQKNGKPKLPKKIRGIERPYGWRFIYTIPEGLCLIDFLKVKLPLETATNAELELWEEDGYLHIRAFTHRLPKKVWFEPFDIPENMVIPIPIGVSRSGLVIVDLLDLPHLLVGGTTGAGKSVFLHGLTYTLCHYPHVEIYVVDLKKIEFVHYRDHVGLATSLDDAVAVISSIRQEMYRRMEILKKASVNNILKYKERMPFIVLVIDEFAQLWPQSKADSKDSYVKKKMCHSYLHDILSLARAVGIHCVISTQRPDRYILPGQLKGNLPATLAFRVRDFKNAGVLDTPLAALIPAELKGRAIWNYGTDREVQVMMFDPGKAKFSIPKTKPVVKQECESLTGAV